MKRVVIAGGGIAGLSIAWAIRRGDPGAQIVVLERGCRLGGNIVTDEIDGYTCEAGPNGFLDNAPDTRQVVRTLGLETRLQPSNDAARRRYVYRQGRLHEVPASLMSGLRTALLSLGGKLRLVCEPLARRRPDGDETIHAFAARHIGEEAASVLVNSMVSGVFAGDPKALSLRACFPRLWDLEERHGSLVRAMVATRRQRTAADAPAAPAGRLTSFTRGMGELVDGFARVLADAIRLDTPALDVRRDPETGNWNVTTAKGFLEADAVVLAGPSSETSELLRTADPRLARELDGIPAAPLAVVCLGYDATRIRPLDGFGFLVPRGEGIRILGALWESSIYPGRAPAGRALLRVMIGGACDRSAVSLGDDELLAVVRADLHKTMGIAVVPEFVRITRHRRGIPQYEVGHLARLERIARLTARHPGLYLAGSSYRGVSMNSCVAEAEGMAGAVLKHPTRTVRYPVAV